MSDPEDSELQALQRQLDDAFQTTRPRAGFEDDLWSRMQARRPLWVQVRDFFAGLLASVRRVPAAPAAAVAVVLVLAIGVGILSLRGPGGGGAGSTATSRDSGTAPLAGGAAASGGGPKTPSKLTGPLPTPALTQAAPSPNLPTRTINGAGYAASYSLYFGPTTLTWGGQLDVTATTLPVYRFQEPTRADADRFAASIGAAPAPNLPREGLGVYSGPNFVVVVSGSTFQPPLEPTFRLTDTTPNGGTDPVGVAFLYLVRHGLRPTWNYQIETQQSIDSKSIRVTFLRLFDLGTQGQANLIDSVGSAYGIEVDLSGGQTRAVAYGALPLNLDAGTYPIITADQAIHSALAQSAPAGSGAPAVRLTGAELVYILVPAGDHSYYEPAFLFSGLFTVEGTTYVKRVLVPAVAA
ncbi:MAG TPA: hypothetical protein VF956_11375 [Candidatus Dormibacteraeota bacterium]